MSYLPELFPDRTGWVLASGIVEDVELSVVSLGPDARRAMRGRFVLTQLSGALGGPYGVTLSRVENDRLEVLAGILIRARAVSVQAMYLPSEGAGVRLPAPQPSEQRPEPAPEPVLATSANASSSWAAAAQAAATAHATPASDEPAEPEAGDLVEHFAFGLCEVLSAEGDRLMLRERGRNGRAREIRIDVLRVHPPTERDGKRLFRLSRRS